MNAAVRLRNCRGCSAWSRPGARPGIALLSAAAVLAACVSDSTRAVDYTWDNGALAAAQDPALTPNGTGIWSVSRTVDTVLVPGSYNWTTIDAVTLQPVPAQWTNGTTTTNGNTAIFASGSPTPWGVNIDGTVTAAGLTFNGNTTIGSYNGTPGTDSLRFTANGATMTVSVAAGVTGTVTADILPNNTAVDQSNVLFKTGAGTLVLGGTTRLATTVNSGTKGPKNSYFTVNGGGAVEVAGRFISTIDNPSLTLYQGDTSYIGNTSSNNTIRVTGSGSMSMWTSDVTFGGSSGGTSYDNNSVILSAPGNATTPTWMIFGDSPQVNMVSSGNLLKIESGAYMRTLGQAGIATWTIGTSTGNDGNSIIVDGTGSTLARGTAALVVGSAGAGNALVFRNGGTYTGGSKIMVGTSGGDDNYQLVTGSGSAQNGGFGDNNTWLQVGMTSGSLRNSLRVENGGAVYQGGSSLSNSRTNGVGWVAGADDNYIKVAGVGSIYKFIHPVPLVIGGQAGLVSSVATITDGGSGNHLDVVDGGLLDLDNQSGLDTKVSTGSTYLALAGTNSVFNLGNGNGISTAVLGKITGYGSGLGLRNADSVLRINSGRVIAGTGIASGDTLVSGAGSVVLNGPAYFSVPTSGAQNAITVPISGIGSLTKEGAGDLLLSNASNSYTGSTTINGGKLQINSPFLSSLAAVTIANGAMIDLNFFDVNVVGGLVVDGQTMPNGDYTWESTTSDGRSFITGIGALRVVQVVPEPGSVLLAVGGLVIVAFGSRRYGRGTARRCTQA
jgi:autotransporter-associated beta strand protein